MGSPVTPAKQVPPFEGELETSVTPSQECEFEHGLHARYMLERVHGRTPRRPGRLRSARNFCDAAPRGLRPQAREGVQGHECPSGPAPRPGSWQVIQLGAQMLSRRSTDYAMELTYCSWARAFVSSGLGRLFGRGAGGLLRRARSRCEWAARGPRGKSLLRPLGQALEQCA